MDEIMVGWGEDTRCAVCLCDLPAGATAYRDGDGVLCVDCHTVEDAHPAPALPAGFAARPDLERIVVDLYCSREGCQPGGGRCASCQETSDAAVAATLAYFREKYPSMTDAEITDKWIHVKGGLAATAGAR